MTGRRGLLISYTGGGMDFQGFFEEIFATSLLRSGFHVLIILVLAWVAMGESKEGK